jgi:hypothetical protein
VSLHGSLMILHGAAVNQLHGVMVCCHGEPPGR